MRTILSAVGVTVLLGGGAMYAQTDPAKMPVRDAHEGVTIAVDTYHTEALAKEKFGKKNPFEAGILAVEVVMRNDNDRAVKVDLDTVRLLLSVPGQQKQRLVPLDLGDVINKILHKGGAPEAKQRRTPIPRLPGSSSKPSKDEQELQEKWQPLVFEMDILPPKSTVHGVMFFDVNHYFEWVQYARFYVPDVTFEQDGKALLFFEIELAPIVKK